MSSKTPPMVCYYCNKTIDRYYWIPTTRVGVYAACCKSCRDELLKDKGAEA